MFGEGAKRSGSAEDNHNTDRTPARLGMLLLAQPFVTLRLTEVSAFSPSFLNSSRRTDAVPVSLGFSSHVRDASLSENTGEVNFRKKTCGTFDCSEHGTSYLAALLTVVVFQKAV